jgi:hypothetical protein
MHHALKCLHNPKTGIEKQKWFFNGMTSLCMNDFSCSFADGFDFGWGFGTDDYDNQFAFDPLPQEAPLADADFHVPGHRRAHSATCSGYSDFLRDLPNPLHRREHSDHAQSMSSDDSTEFESMCRDTLVKFNPRKLGFVPLSHWEDTEVTFGGLVASHFQQKSGRNTRFFHKLYNALKMSELDRFYSEYLGVEWVTDRLIKIDKKKFARLLGIHAIDGSLFHRQGNFPSHGFREIGPEEAKEMVPADELAMVDYDNVRLLIHAPGNFVRGSTPQDFDQCRWINPKQK